MQIGILGAGGFIGSYLLERLRERACGDLRLFSRNPNFNPPAAAEVVFGDLASLADCRRFARGLDLIYYLAHQNSPVDSDGDQVQDAALNLVPLLTFLKAVETFGSCPRVVYFSSGGAVYGSASGRIPFREDHPCNPTCSYGVQKLAAEHYLRIAAENGKISAAILRVGNAFGTLLPRDRMQGLIGVALNNVLHRLPVRIFGNAENVRDYVHLSDVCDLAILAGATREPFTIVNVGRGEGFSVREVLRMVEVCSQMPMTVQLDSQSGQKLTDWAVLDISKAQREYGWRPEITLPAGISEMVERGRSAHLGELQLAARGHA